ncbi:hypothetical protein HGP16_21190 [Rhizobium sp. P40RR-XXII]|uniref:immunity 8 family protein n=1 Tax=unclassified Rhizobium TaxID=2613769 RepID=UPI0014565F87|nr:MULTISPECIES: immunity 8 family protein [unclassified Rhizobium]NLR88042.1 hypothetical protein [Rhizobium sp. P28RR-XV]NLS19058.1 hypothetical protein [Rhizobium sp. P40RR-XXII]
MKAEVKQYSMVGGEFSSYWPDDVTDFCIGADVTVGPEGVPGGDIFSFQVCTPRWLAHSAGGKPCFIRHTILMDEYDEDVLKSTVRKLVENTTGNSWEEIAKKLARYMFWEFEDYQA